MVFREAPAGLGDPAPGPDIPDRGDIPGGQGLGPDNHGFRCHILYPEGKQPQVIADPDLLCRHRHAAAVVRGQVLFRTVLPPLPGDTPVQTELSPEGGHGSGAGAKEPQLRFLPDFHYVQPRGLCLEPADGPQAHQQGQPGKPQANKQQQPADPLPGGQIKGDGQKQYRQVPKTMPRHISAASAREPCRGSTAAHPPRSSPGFPPGGTG